MQWSSISSFSCFFQSGPNLFVLLFTVMNPELFCKTAESESDRRPSLRLLHAYVLQSSCRGLRKSAMFPYAWMQGVLIKKILADNSVSELIRRQAK